MQRKRKTLIVTLHDSADDEFAILAHRSQLPGFIKIKGQQLLFVAKPGDEKHIEPDQWYHVYRTEYQEVRPRKQVQLLPDFFPEKALFNTNVVITVFEETDLFYVISEDDWERACKLPARAHMTGREVDIAKHITRVVN